MNSLPRLPSYVCGRPTFGLSSDWLQSLPLSHHIGFTSLREISYKLMSEPVGRKKENGDVPEAVWSVVFLSGTKPHDSPLQVVPSLVGQNSCLG